MSRAVSSRSRGARKRGVTRAVPSHPSSAAASAATAAAPSAPMSSSSRYTTSPDARCAQPPTTRPAHHTVGPTFPVRSNITGTCRGSRYQPRACHPIGVGSSAGSSAATLGAPAGKSRSSASAIPACPSRSTSATGSAASAALVWAPVQPAHHRRSATGPGPKTVSHRRASSARAAPASSPAPSPSFSPASSHASGRNHSNCPDDHPPRRCPRIIRPSAAISTSTREVMLAAPPYALPGA